MPKRASYLGEVIAFFDPMMPVDAEHVEWYVERPDSPHDRLKVFLLHNQADCKVLFSGHRGSGKSSALNRLVADAEIQGKFFVVQFSIKDELNVADLTYTDLLIAIGHRLYKQAEPLGLGDALKEDLDRWSEEVTRVATRGSEGDIVAKGEIGAFFLKATGLLKTGFGEKREFRQRFEPRIPQLLEHINRIIRAVETHPHCGQREVLIVLEDLDKPSLDVALDLFHVKGPILTEPQCKIVFTVPTALLYSGKYRVVRENFNPQFILPNFKVKERSGERNQDAWEKMKEIVLRRLDQRLIEGGALEYAVDMSGGVVRELVRIIQGAASQALAASANCIKLEHVQREVESLRAEYSFTLTREEDFELLRQVNRTGKLISKDEEPLLNLLHNLIILYYPNGEGWYGVNPIVHRLAGLGE